MTRMSFHVAQSRSYRVCLAVCLAGSLAANSAADDQTRINDDPGNRPAVVDEQVRQNPEVQTPRHVMLHVKVVEVKRGQLRVLENAAHVFGGSDRSQPGRPAGITGVFENERVSRLIEWLTRDDAARIVAAPTLTVVSGHSASFMSGIFPVPAIVGGTGQQATPTPFRSGTTLLVRAEVMEKDWIKLDITPEHQSLSWGAGPRLSYGRHQTTVKLREGQSVVVKNTTSTSTQRPSNSVPFLGELPVIGNALQQRRQRKEDAETEQLFIVTPELVKPVEPNEVPPLPGFNVTSPNDIELYSLVRPAETRPRGPDERQPVAPLPDAYDLTDDVQYFPPSPKFRLWNQVAQPFQWRNISRVSEPAAIQRARHFDLNCLQRTAPVPLPQSAPDCPPSYPVPASLRPDDSPHWFNWCMRDPSTERLEHLRRALAALQAAGLTEQVKAVEREITKEQLARKERDADALQRQIQLLRRTLGVPAPIPESPLPTATP